MCVCVCVCACACVRVRVRVCVQELAAAVGSCWEKNVGRVCFGADWDLLTGIEDVKVLYIHCTLFQHTIII